MKNGRTSFILVTTGSMCATQESAQILADQFQKMCEPIPPDTEEVQHHIVLGIT